MNTGISASTQLALRKQVERAVRPVRAGKRRKMLMREELLAHLTALYEEELSRQPAEPAAMREALARFGDPAALTSDLNESMGWQERYQFHEDRLGAIIDSWFEFREDDPLWRAALRAGVVIGLMVLLLAVALSILSVFDTERLTDPTKYPLAWKVLIYIFLSMWSFLLATHATCRTLGGAPRWRWLAAGLQSLIWSLVFILLSIVLWLSIEFSVKAAFDKLPVIATGSFALLAPCLLLLAWVIRLDAAKRRVCREWQNLQLEE